MELSGYFIIIGITLPHAWSSPQDEARAITSYLESDAIDIFHIRKKEASEEYTVSLLRAIPAHLHPRLSLHSHYQLRNAFDFGYIHGDFSESFHTLEEIKHYEGRGYCFLSPIFDSISKPGYKSRFALDRDLITDVIDNRNVIALGGITPADFDKLFTAKFAGAALLGYLWPSKLNIEDKIKALKLARNNIKNT